MASPFDRQSSAKVEFTKINLTNCHLKTNFYIDSVFISTTEKRQLRSMLVKHVYATFAQGRMSVTSAMQAVREAVTQAWDSRACQAAADTGLCRSM
ncbi:hypothetical protein GPU89_35120 [Burkholderia cepacia]|nr:hypothetical protein [Burkholderia cepacia]